MGLACSGRLPVVFSTAPRLRRDALRLIAALLTAAVATAASAGAQTVTFPKTTFPSAAGAAPSKVLPMRDGRMLLLSPSQIEVFDPVSGTVVATTASTVFPGGAAAALLNDGRVLVAGGGTAPGTKSASIVTVAGSTITVAATANMAAARTGHALATLADGRAVAFGGGALNLDVYSPSTSTFSTVSGGTTQTVPAGFTLPNGNLLFVSPGVSRVLSGTTLTQVSSVTHPAGFAATAAVLLLDGRAVLIGGAQTEILAATASPVTIAAGPSLPTATSSAQAVVLGDGSVLVADASGPLVQRWTPAGAASVIDTLDTNPSALGPLASGGAFGCCDGLGHPYAYTPAGGMPAFMPVSAGARKARTDVQGVLLNDGRVAAIAGSTNAIDVYDPATGASYTVTSGTPRSQVGIVALDDGRLFVAGGVTPSTTLLSTAFASSSGPPLSSARVRPTLVKLADGRVLIVGGATAATALEIASDTLVTPVPAAEIFDPASNSVTTVAGWANGRYGSTATPMPDGSVYVIGGHDGGSVSRGIDRFDPSTNTFTSAGQLVSGRYWHTATAIDATHILVAGGLGEEGPGNIGVLGKLELYDTTTHTAARLATNLSRARYGHAALLRADGTVLFAGGIAGPVALDPEVYDPVANTVTVLAPLDAAGTQSVNRSTLLRTAGGQPVLLLDSLNTSSADNIYVLRDGVLGAEDLVARYGSAATVLADAGQSLSDSVRFWFNAWDAIRATDNTRRHVVTDGQLTRARSLASAVVLQGGKVLVTGGNDENGSSVNADTAEVYDPAAHTSVATGNMGTTHVSHWSTLLPDGRALVAGNVSEVFDPATGTFSQLTGATLLTGTTTNPISLPGGRTLAVRTNSGMTMFDSVSMRAITLGSAFGTGSGMPAVARQPNGDVLIYPGSNPQVTTGAAAPFTRVVWRMRDVAGQAAAISHPGGYSSTSPISIHVVGLAPNASIPRNSVVYLFGRTNTSTVTATATALADGSADVSITAPGAAVVPDGSGVRFMPDVVGSVTAAAGATTITITGLTEGVSVTAGQRLVFGAGTSTPTTVEAAQDASADATGAAIVVLGAPLPAALSSQSVRLDLWPDTTLATDRNAATVIDLGDGRFAVAGGVSYEAGTTAVTDQSVSIYDTAAKVFSTLAQPLTYQIGSFPPAIALGGGRGLIIDNDMELVDGTAGTVTLDAVLPSRRSNAGGVLLPDGRVLVLGGIAVDGSSRDVLAYLPGSSYNEMVVTMAQQLATAQAQIAALNTQVSQLTAQIAALQAQVDTIPGLQAQILSLQQELAGVQAQLQQAQADIAALQQQLDAANAANSQLQTANASLEAQVASLQRQLADTQAQLGDANLQVAALTAQNAALLQQVAALQQVANGAAGLVASLQQLLAALPGGGFIPGATLTDQLTRLANAIKVMPQGAQIQLAKALAGRK